jgi:outer membrane protein assembly factor BamB
VIKWTFVAESEIQVGPAIGTDGTVYVSCKTGKLIALTPGGELRWIYPSASGTGEPFTSPGIGPDGTIYVCSKESRLYAVNPDGTEKWHRSYQGQLTGATMIGQDGTVYLCSSDTKLRAVSPDGELLWSFVPKPAAGGTLALAQDGTIYLCTGAGVYALDPAGQQKWHTQISGGSPAVDAEGTIYLGTGSPDRIVALNPDGSLKFEETITIDYPVHYSASDMTIGPDGRLYSGLGYSICCYGDR